MGFHGESYDPPKWSGEQKSCMEKEFRIMYETESHFSKKISNTMQIHSKNKMRAYIENVRFLED